MKSLRVSTLLALVGAFTAAFSVGIASGHAAYKGSDPPDGASLPTPPSSITAEFSEPLRQGSYLRVFDPCGQQVDNGDVRLLGYEMSVSMEGSRAGTYVVTFLALSQIDPHATSGDFGFNVVRGEPCPGTASAEGPGTSGEQGAGAEGSAPSGASSSADGSSASGGDSSEDSVAGSASDGSRAGGSAGDSDVAKPGRGGAQERSRPRGRSDVRLAAGEDPELAQPTVWEGIRLRPFLVGLALAALIGAGGGKIYAGIMGPRA